MEATHPSIEILRISALFLEEILPTLDPKDSQHQALRDALRKETFFETESSFCQNPLFIAHLQILLLMCLSLHGGVTVPSISSLKEQDRVISILWSNGLRDRMEIGVFNRDFYTLFKQICRDVLKFKFDNNSEGIPVGIYQSITDKLLSYQLLLEVLIVRIKKIMDNDREFEVLFNDNGNTDLLFILIGSLPQNLLNEFFTYIFPFFPDELSFKTSRGNQVNVVSFFREPSSDIGYLIDKVKTYFDLYHTGKYPIIREITQTKTREFFLKIIKEKRHKDSILEILNSLFENQLISRDQLYIMCLDNLHKLLVKPIK